MGEFVTLETSRVPEIGIIRLDRPERGNALLRKFEQTQG